MKSVEWDECISRRANCEYPSDDKLLNPDDEITVGMHVSAMHKGNYIAMEILDVFDNNYLAKVLTDYGTEDLPDDTKVPIDRAHVCCIFSSKIK